MGGNTCKGLADFFHQGLLPLLLSCTHKKAMLW